MFIFNIRFSGIRILPQVNGGYLGNQGVPAYYLNTLYNNFSSPANYLGHLYQFPFNYSNYGYQNYLNPYANSFLRGNNYYSNGYLNNWLIFENHDKLVEATKLAHQLGYIKFALAHYRIAQCPGFMELEQYKGRMTKALQSCLKEINN